MSTHASGSELFRLGEGEVGGDGPLDDIFDAGGNWRCAPAPWPEPEQALAQREFRQVLIDRIAALPPLQARAFSLRELDGLSAEEIMQRERHHAVGALNAAAQAFVALYENRLST